MLSMLTSFNKFTTATANNYYYGEMELVLRIKQTRDIFKLSKSENITSQSLKYSRNLKQWPSCRLSTGVTNLIYLAQTLGWGRVCGYFRGKKANVFIIDHRIDKIFVFQLCISS